MKLTVHGAIEMARGSDVISVRPEGDIIVVEMPSWRSGWSALGLFWAQRALFRRAKKQLAAEGISIVARIRKREIYRPTIHHYQTKEKIMAEKRDDTRTWPELAAGLYEQLTGRGAEINYQFENLEVAVPSRTGSGAEHANWKLNGAIRIRTQDVPKS